MKDSEERRKDLDTIEYFMKKRNHSDKYILIKAWILYSNGRLQPYNWGDDMNYYLTGMLSGKEVLPLPDSRILGITRLKAIWFLAAP